MKDIITYVKTINDIINESAINNDDELKNQVCINLAKIIDQKNIDKISSDSKGNNWKIVLKGTNTIDLIELSKEIIKINNDSKYDIIKNILLEYDTKTIIIS